MTSHGQWNVTQALWPVVQDSQWFDIKPLFQVWSPDVSIQHCTFPPSKIQVLAAWYLCHFQQDVCTGTFFRVWFMLPSQENYTNVPYRQEDKRGLPLQYTLQYWVLLSFVIFANLIGISLVMSQAEEFFVHLRWFVILLCIEFLCLGWFFSCVFIAVILICKNSLLKISTLLYMLQKPSLADCFIIVYDF